MKKKIRLRKWVIAALIGIPILAIMILFSSSEKEEIRATWISYIDYNEILLNKSEQEYRYNVLEMLEDLKNLNMNTIYAHASAFTDAFYDSEYYPTSYYISGNCGDKLMFDPFEILVEEAKAQGFRVEAWINPLRSFSLERMKDVPSDSIQQTWLSNNSRYLVLYEGHYYLNPAYQEVQDLIINVAVELINNYDIDGIHIDDYFYPDQVKEGFDEYEYSRLEGNRSLAEFRKDNVNALITNLSQAIKEADSSCDFTVSPAGNIDYSTNTIYGDVATWIEKGLIDMVIPQIYFGYEHEVLPFDTCLKQWEDLVEGTSVELVVGLGAYKINTIDQFAKSGDEEWLNEDDILARQIKDARKSNNYRGFSLFSYHTMKYPDEESSSLVSKQIENIMELLH